MNLDNIAEEISFLDFDGIDPDNTDEAIYNIAIDWYDLNEDEADKVVDILMEKYIENIE